MKIVTWNICDQQGRSGALKDWKPQYLPKPLPKETRLANYAQHMPFLRDSGADIICLQELTEENVGYIRDHLEEFLPDHTLHPLPFHENPGPYERTLGVILPNSSNVTSNQEIKCEDYPTDTILSEPVDNRPVLQQIEFEMNSGQKMRVINAHLSWSTQPEQRAHELQKALEATQNYDNRANIVAGDFNSFGGNNEHGLNSLGRNLFGLGANAAFTSFTAWFKKPKHWKGHTDNDCANIRKLGNQYGFTGLHTPGTQSTFGYGRRHLDHILSDSKIKKKAAGNHIEEGLHGSDHKPVVMEFDFKEAVFEIEFDYSLDQLLVPEEEIVRAPLKIGDSGNTYNK